MTQIDPPTDDQLRIARAVLGPLTDTQRRAVYAVVLYEAALELDDLRRQFAQAGALFDRRTDELDQLREFCRRIGILPDDLPAPSSFDRVLRERLGGEAVQQAEAERDAAVGRAERAERRLDEAMKRR